VLIWEDEIDIAPETLYAEATGSPLPNWMDSRGHLPAESDLEIESA